jgi:type I restriction-modification system DNA methylase subunit
MSEQMHGNGLTDQFKQGLLKLDMIDPENPGSSGLVFKDHLIPNRHEHIAMEKALKYDIDAVYFRRFEDGRPSIPQVYIYDYTRFEKDETEIAQLHRRLWNSGQVPLFFIFTRTEIKIFNCLNSPQIEGDKFISSPFQVIALAAAVENRLNEKNRKEFSARKFDNGSFWDTSEYKDVFSMSNSSYETLLIHLREFRNEIIKKKILEPAVANKILVMSILVKYLEERVDREGNTVFPKDFFQGFAEGANDFAGILRKKGACLELFDYLSGHFNGEIFKWENGRERETLTQTDLTPLAVFLEARRDIDGQGTLWRKYSFNDLPIELISNIYEEFLGNNKEGVVYTPPYLVHFLIDEAMPLDCTAENFKVLDPACGSGVFLVAAYKRIIDWWRIRHNWEIPGLDKLKELLRNNIFGVDISPEAVRMTIFSLSLVLLDELSPKEIWENLKFDNLKRNGNLFEKDFFELIEHRGIKEDFDLVIGNPPFIPIDTPSAMNIEEKQKKYRPSIPNNQIALLFFEQSLIVCKPGGLNCLILPAEAFLYNYRSVNIRKYFLETFNIKQILDFTPLREILFGSANAAVSVVFAKKEEPDFKPVLHAIFRRTKASKEKFYFELDHYDLHPVSYQDATKSPFIWKVNLLGGGRLRHMISRLSKLRKFGSYIKEKVKKEGWVVAEGFIVGNKVKIARLKELAAKGNALSAQEAEELKRLQKKYKTADYLTGKPTLPTEALTEEGIYEKQIHLLGEDFFQYPRGKNKLIFKKPHLLIKEIATRDSIPIGFSDDDFSFKDRIAGIHAPVDQREELIAIEKNLKGNKICLFYAAAFSGQYMISRGVALQKKDIENIPYPEDWTELEMSDIEKILVEDTLKYMPDFREKGENSILLNPVDIDQLDLFGKTFCKILNTVYDKFKPSEPIETAHYICYPVYYNEKPELEEGDPEKLESHLNNLVYKEFQKHLRVVRVIRIYDKNVIYLVKPKQLRYWLRSIAVRDADETFEDLVKQGY